MVEFYYNCSINEASKHSPFEVSYGFQPTTLVDILFPVTCAPAPIDERLTELASVRDVARELLTLSKQRMATRSFKPAPTFGVGDYVFLSSKGLHIHSKKCKYLRDQRLGPFQVIEKIGLKSYKLNQCDLLSKASISTPLRHQPAEIGSDDDEYANDLIFDAKVDNWPNRRGLYFQFFTHFVGYDVTEWMLLEQVDDCEQLFVLISSNVWAQFSQTQAYVQFKTQHLARDVDLHK